MREVSGYFKLYAQRAVNRIIVQAIKSLVENGEESGLTPEVCEQLLLDSTPESTEFPGVESVAGESGGSVDERVELCAGEAGKDTEGGLKFIIGYPDSPLYIRLADCMSYWLLTG